MISTNEDVIVIVRWLEDLIRESGIPKEIFIEDSITLLQATVNLTQYLTVTEYLNQCHLILDEDNKLERPNVLIRQDATNFCRYLLCSNIFKCEKPKVRLFFLHAICLLLKVENFNEVKQIIKDILVMALTELETNNTEMSRKQLILKFEHFNIKHFFEEFSNNSEEKGKVDDFSSIMSSTDVKWFQDIKSYVLKFESPTDHLDKDNYFHFPNFFPFFKHLIYTIPLWGAVMNNIIDETSLKLAPEFKCIESNFLHNEKPIKVDQFVFQHIKEITGKMIIVVSDINASYKSTKGIYIYS